MTITEVAMFTARCNVCGKSAADRGAEYAGWSDRSTALSEWGDSDYGVTFSDDGVVCHVCIPFERCPELDEDEGHTWETYGGDCGEGCGRNVAAVLAAVPVVGGEGRQHGEP